MRKKIMAAALTAVLCISLAACSNRTEEVPEETTIASETNTIAEVETTVEQTEESTVAPEEEERPLQVCVVYGGFVEQDVDLKSCREGVKLAEEMFEIEVTSLEGDSEAEWEAGILEACEKGYDLIIGASAEIADCTAKYAAEYPRTDFAVIDAEIGLPNVQSIDFSEKEGYFFAGAVAALLTERTEIEGMNGDSKIGWVAGIDIPIIRECLNAYEQGAQYVNPEIEILQDLSGEWMNLEKSIEIVTGQFEQGADLVLYLPFDLEDGALGSADERGLYIKGDGDDGSDDTDILTDNVAGGQENSQPGTFLTVPERKLDIAVYQVIEEVVEGTFAGGTTVSHTYMDGGVVLKDFAESEKTLDEKTLQDVRELCENLTRKLLTGEILVGAVEATGSNNQ